MSSQISEKIYSAYRSGLSDLTFNSKPIITNLTIIANEQKSHGNSIVSAIQDHLKTVKPAMKLPAFYLIDSIIKNNGASYISLFQTRIYDIFSSTYSSVDPKAKANMERVLATWFNFSSKRPLFPKGILNKIQAFVNSSKAPSNHSNLSIPPQNQRPIDSSRATRPQSEQPSRNLNAIQNPTNPPKDPVHSELQSLLLDTNNILIKKQIERLKFPKNANLLSEIAVLQQVQNMAKAKKIPPSQIDSIRKRVTALGLNTHSSALPERQTKSLKRENADSDPMSQSKKAATVSPKRTPDKQPKPSATGSCDINGNRSPAKLSVSPSNRDQISQPSHINSGTYNSFQSADSNTNFSTPSFNQSQNSWSSPNNFSNQKPTPNMYNNSQQYSSNSYTGNPTQPNYENKGFDSSYLNPQSSGFNNNSRHSTDFSTFTNSSQALPLSNQMLIDSLKASGILGDLANFVPGLIQPGASSNLATPIQQSSKSLEVAFTTESLLINRPNAYTCLYDDLPTYCYQCGWRSSEASDSKEKPHMRAHLDWHFRHNRRMKEAVRFRRPRGWFVGSDKWLTDDHDSSKVSESYNFSPFDNPDGFSTSENQNPLNSLQNGSNSSSKPSGGAVNGNSSGSTKCDAKRKSLMEKRVKITDEYTNNVCIMCKEPIESFWSESDEEWYYTNAVVHDGVVYHATCYSDLAKSPNPQIPQTSKQPNQDSAYSSASASIGLDDSDDKNVKRSIQLNSKSATGQVTPPSQDSNNIYEIKRSPKIHMDPTSVV